MCCVWIWEQTAVISLYSINWLVCITEMECVYCAVRTKSLNERYTVSSWKGSSSSIELQLWEILGLLYNILPFKAVLYLLCPIYKLHLLQIIPDIVFPSRLGPSSWSSCERFPFVYSFYCASFGHSIYVSKPTQSLDFNIIYCVPVFS